MNFWANWYEPYFRLEGIQVIWRMDLIAYKANYIVYIHIKYDASPQRTVQASGEGEVDETKWIVQFSKAKDTPSG